MCAVLEEKPETNVHIWFFLERDALTGNTALDLERHLERCPAGIELLHDLFQRGGIGKIKFTGTGRKCCLFHAVGKVCHGAFSFQKSSMCLTCGVLPDLFVTVLHLKAMPGLLPLPAQPPIASAKSRTSGFASCRSLALVTILLCPWVFRRRDTDAAENAGVFP